MIIKHREIVRQIMIIHPEYAKYLSPDRKRIADEISLGQSNIVIGNVIGISQESASSRIKTIATILSRKLPIEERKKILNECSVNKNTRKIPTEKYYCNSQGIVKDQISFSEKINGKKLVNWRYCPHCGHKLE